MKVDALLLKGVQAETRLIGARHTVLICRRVSPLARLTHLGVALFGVKLTATTTLQARSGALASTNSTPCATAALSAACAPLLPIFPHVTKLFKVTGYTLGWVGCRVLLFTGAIFTLDVTRFETHSTRSITRAPRTPNAPTRAFTRRTLDHATIAWFLMPPAIHWAVLRACSLAELNATSACARALVPACPR